MHLGVKLDGEPTRRAYVHVLVLLCAGGLVAAASFAQVGEPVWLAGDSHIHSHWSPGYDRSTTPPTPVQGQDGTPRTSATGKPTGARGSYGNPDAPTLGGFDQMTAVVGGFWDSLLGEGRGFWIVASSDSHVNYTEVTRRGNDFWPGEFHKTYVHARKTYDDVLEGLRRGRTFAVAGDLITKLDVHASAGSQTATVGETLSITPEASVTVTIRFRDPDSANNGGRTPRVSRVDLIVGDVRGPLIDRHAHTNETTRVHARFGPQSWRRIDDEYEIVAKLPVIERAMYLRVRGTNTTDLEPQRDVPGEDPWADLWFYSNPIFITIGAR